MAGWGTGDEAMQREMRRMSQHNTLLKSELIIPFVRKAILLGLSTTSLINMVLVICSIVYPVPQWNAGAGLFEVRAILNASVNGRSEAGRPVYQHALADTYQQDDAVLTTAVYTVWDAHCQCYHPTTSTLTVTVVATTTDRSTIVHPITRTTATSQSAQPTLATGAPQNTTSEVEAGSFAGLWLGVLGGCLQKRSGVLVCTSSSFSADYGGIFSQAGLNTNVSQQMPQGPGGAAVGLLVSIISFVLTMAFFISSMSPAFLAFGPQTWASHVDMRHTYFVTFATMMGAVGCFAVAASTISLRNAFGGSADAVQAWDPSKTLRAKLLSAFSLLYAAAAMSAGVLLTGLGLIALDFRKPWWFRQIRQGELWAAQNADVAPLPVQATMPVPATPATTRFTGSNWMPGSRATGW